MRTALRPLLAPLTAASVAVAGLVALAPVTQAAPAAVAPTPTSR